MAYMGSWLDDLKNWIKNKDSSDPNLSTSAQLAVDAAASNEPIATTPETYSVAGIIDNAITTAENSVKSLSSSIQSTIIIVALGSVLIYFLIHKK